MSKTSPSRTSGNVESAPADESAVPVPGFKLTHAAIMTSRLEDAIAFYRDVLGFRVRITGDDPVRPGRKRAMMADAEDVDLVEIIEMTELAHPSIPGRGGIHHIGFTLPPPQWHSLRSRLDACGHHYQETGGRLFVRDADGLVLEIEIR